MPLAPVDGAELNYEDLGSGRATLLIHGTGGCIEIWGEVPALLSRTRRVVVYDRRGFGGSSRAAASDLDRHLADATALLDRLEVETATVVGWSGGGALALGFAAAYPARVAELVLVEPAVHLITRPSLAGLAMIARSTIARRIRRDDRAAAAAMYRWASRYTTGGNAYDAYPDPWRDAMLAHADATVREMDQLAAPYPSRRAIRSVSAPTACVVGTLSDPAFSRASRLVVSLVPGVRRVAIEGAAHMVPTDRPGELVAAIEQASIGADPQ